ncbi:50S ribosomal protein L22 [Alkalibaculum sp. M08DMB]|uniref:Large ribosomal subunit protein uL22 n=1 Tax=Alkalibaculum sporogenes TaxID=2655001 RepID=A0A6A7K6Q3_9FIRM|nr:50S ribosomal protein L22 [Alkalibaculum sporogenes]MPW25022.1 50S ribosomal protein L22 [Alkalibaculum sporogenes]
MEAKAIVKYVGISPRKAKLVIDLIRGKNLGEAVNILALMPNKAAKVVDKLVKSAAANAENNFDMDPAKLYVAEICANQGPTLKRFRAGSMGRASVIKKRSSHIAVVLKEKE